MLWAAAVDGRGRPASVIGAAACLGLLAVEPIARVVTRRSIHVLLPQPLAVIPFAVVHLGAVYAASRIAGLRRDTGEAATIAITTLVATLVIAAGVGLLWPAPEPHVSDVHPAPA
jgi:hypothetical protein